MKSLFVLLLLTVVVSVVLGTKKCYFCVDKCGEDDIVEMECEKDTYCISIIVSDPDSEAQSMKSCTFNGESEESQCRQANENGDKCYVCNGDFCNKNDEKEDDDDEYDAEDGE